MKIRKQRKLKESATGQFWLITKFNSEEDRTEYEVLQGPRHEAMDYMIEQTADFLVDELGQEEDLSIFPISSAMAARLDNSIAITIINKTIKEIFDFKIPIYATSSLNASDWVVDYVNETESDPEAVLDDPSFDVIDTSETPAFKQWLTGKIRSEVTQAFNQYFS